MATTTTNYAWTIPQSTDLVKDGATAIATLGSAIDTSMNTALGTKKSGLVLLNTTSFTAQSSVSVSDVFSTTYDNYRLIFTGASTTTDNIGLRLRVSGTDANTNYNYQRLSGDAATAGAARSTAQAQFLFNLDDVYASASSIEIFRPFIAAATICRVVSAFGESASAIYDYVGLHTTATSYTGFTFFKITSGDMTGTVSVYGYNK